MLKGGSTVAVGVLLVAAVQSSLAFDSGLVPSRELADLMMSGGRFQIQPAPADATKVVTPVQMEPPEYCRETAEIAGLTLAAHYRKISNPENLYERTRTAFLDAFTQIKLPAGMTPGKVTARLEEIEKKQGGKFSPMKITEDGKVGISCELKEVAGLLTGGDIEPYALHDAFLNSFLKGMDPHSGILGGERAAATQDRLDGKAMGIGITYGKTDDGKTILIDVADESPAFNAGLQIGDQILSIRRGFFEADMAKATPEEIQKVVKGAKGENVDFEVQRTNGDRLTVTVTIEEYEIYFSRIRQLPDGVLHVKLFTFGDSATAQIERRMKKYQNVTGVILDLRFNGGGALEEARQLVDLFVDRGLVASVWDRDGNLARRGIHMATNEGVVTDKPLVVLVNEFSASASELVAQSLSSTDYGRALVMGRQTYGKGTVNVFYSLPRERFLILTQFAYHTMSGISPHVTGVMPDMPAPDPYAEKIINERRERGMRGEKVGPLREVDQPATLGMIPGLSLAQRETVGGVVESNPIRTLMALVTGNILTLPSERLRDADPGIDSADQVVSTLAGLCGSYKTDSCRIKPELVSYLTPHR